MIFVAKIILDCMLLQQIVKEGPTPLGQVEFVLDIPVNITDENFLKIYHPKVKPLYCLLLFFI